MMNELVNTVAEKTGLSPDQARAAVETVLGFLKGRMPAPIAEGLDSLLNGNESSAGLEGKAVAALENLFGSKS